MREILFKAKRIDNGEWVEGFYFCMVHDDGRHIHHFIMPLGVDLSLGTPIEKIQVEVNSNTICQYTGLTDKNGNKIWENDVVYIPYERLEDSYCKVIFRRGEFIGEMADGFEDCLLNRKTEVIGNIFDNPELLKGE